MPPYDLKSYLETIHVVPDDTGTPLLKVFRDKVNNLQMKDIKAAPYSDAPYGILFGLGRVIQPMHGTLSRAYQSYQFTLRKNASPSGDLIDGDVDEVLTQMSSIMAHVITAARNPDVTLLDTNYGLVGTYDLILEEEPHFSAGSFNGIEAYARFRCQLLR